MKKLDIMRMRGEKWELVGGKPTRIEKGFDFINNQLIKVEEVKVIKFVEEERQISISFEQELDKIKGIGKETIKDIKRIYKNKEELIVALKEDKVPLRNDVVKKLKEVFVII